MTPVANKAYGLSPAKVRFLFPTLETNKSIRMASALRHQTIARAVIHKPKR